MFVMTHFVLPWLIGNGILACLVTIRATDRLAAQKRNRRRY